jgi:hypothetical protein
LKTSEEKTIILLKSIFCIYVLSGLTLLAAALLQVFSAKAVDAETARTSLVKLVFGLILYLIAKLIIRKHIEQLIKLKRG